MSENKYSNIFNVFACYNTALLKLLLSWNEKVKIKEGKKSRIPDQNLSQLNTINFYQKLLSIVCKNSKKIEKN